MARYEIAVEEFADDGVTPDLYCILLDGRQVGPAFDNKVEAEAWIADQTAI